MVGRGCSTHTNGTTSGDIGITFRYLHPPRSTRLYPDSALRIPRVRPGDGHGGWDLTAATKGRRQTTEGKAQHDRVVVFCLNMSSGPHIFATQANSVMNTSKEAPR